MEIESDIDYRQAKKIFELLGYKTFFRYTKTRDVYEFRKCSIVLDYLARLGWFLEIEGSPKEISFIAANLHLESSDEEHRSYPQLLNVEWIN